MYINIFSVIFKTKYWNMQINFYINLCCMLPCWAYEPRQNAATAWATSRTAEARQWPAPAPCWSPTAAGPAPWPPRRWPFRTCDVSTTRESPAKGRFRCWEKSKFPRNYREGEIIFCHPPLSSSIKRTARRIWNSILLTEMFQFSNK